MKPWCKVMAVILALLWLPVTSHCLLEEAGLIHHDACCQTTLGEDHSHGHDAADGSCQVESRQIAAQKHDVLKAVVLVTFLAAGELFSTDLPAVTSISGDGVAPPELSPTWQFVSRAAVSPRAPSVLL